MEKTVIYLLEDGYVDFVVEKIHKKMKKLLEEKEKIFAVLAGGRTPLPVYEKLAEQKLPWNCIHFFLSDERYVPIDSDQSNFRNINEVLFSRAKIPSSNVHYIDTSLSIKKACEKYEREIRSITDQFDLAILGMGPDGHVASIFDLETGNKDVFVTFTDPSGDPEVPRVTLTFRALNTSRYVLFLIRGKEKINRLAEILKEEPLPAYFVRGKEKTVWLVGK
ncbi:6-phosphogluconolactonase [Thermotoga petrophila RKU-1]|uniref:6-phosphogluconolactonase n=1 Tax=Thermotoga petrophila (strain ATCC BAA-488 / DSM 13995 / JCM 10881 / RKU-1) TaxID=390874 RepID=A5IN29_THEP1|nr:6-phosphogluconolactonase [Thermotoga petrophila]ABQ47602.1 6-phosphogluconolactonase [Thermotoga petrophila RKU-1]